MNESKYKLLTMRALTAVQLCLRTAAYEKQAQSQHCYMQQHAKWLEAFISTTCTSVRMRYITLCQPTRLISCSLCRNHRMLVLMRV